MTQASQIGTAQIGTALIPDVLASWKHGPVPAPGDLCELVMVQLAPGEAPCEMLVSVTAAGAATRCQVVCDGRCDLDFAFAPPAGSPQQRVAAVVRAALEWRVTVAP